MITLMVEEQRTRIGFEWTVNRYISLFFCYKHGMFCTSISDSNYSQRDINTSLEIGPIP